MEDFSAFIVVGETYRFLGRSFGAFLRRSLLAILFTDFALFLVLHEANQKLPPHALEAAIAACTVLAGLLAVHFSVGWHRYVLRPEIAPAEGAQRLRLALTYIRATFVIVVSSLIPLAGVLMAVALLGSAVSLPALVLAGFLMAAMIGKLALAWPAAAIGRRHVLRHGWVMSSGLAPRLVLILLLTVGPFEAAAVGLFCTALDAAEPALFVALLVGAALLAILGAAAGATALSVTYRWRLRQDNSHWWRHAG